MPFTQEDLELIRDLEEEAYGPVPEGIQHLRFEESKEPIGKAKDGKPYLRLRSSVVCGPFTGQAVSSSFWFYGSENSTSEKPLADRNKQTKAIFGGRMGGIYKAIGTSVPSMAEAIQGLRALDNNEPDTENTVRLMQDIADAVTGRDVYARVSKDDTGRAKVAFLTKDHQDAVCECGEGAGDLPF